MTEPAGLSSARVALASLAALALSELLWETVWAPLRPGGSWLALKALPLALLWLFAARGSVRAWRITLLLLPFYFADALVAAITGTHRVRLAATVVAIIAAVAFAAGLALFRGRRG